MGDIARPRFKWNNTDLSAWVVDAELMFDLEEHDDTTSTKNTRTADLGLEVIGLTVTFIKPSEAGGPEATIFADYKAKTVRQVKVRPVNTTTAGTATDPFYQGNFRCKKLPVVGGGVGDQRRVTYEFRAAGDVSRQVAGAF